MHDGVGEGMREERGIGGAVGPHVTHSFTECHSYVCVYVYVHTHTTLLTTPPQVMDFLQASLSDFYRTAGKHVSRAEKPVDGCG